MTSSPHRIYNALSFYESNQTRISSPETLRTYFKRVLVSELFTKDTWIARLSFADACFESACQLPSAILKAAYKTLTAVGYFFKEDSAHYSPKANFQAAWKGLGLEVFGIVDGALGVVTPGGASKVSEWRGNSARWLCTSTSKPVNPPAIKSNALNPHLSSPPPAET